MGGIRLESLFSCLIVHTESINTGHMALRNQSPQKTVTPGTQGIYQGLVCIEAAGIKASAFTLA